MLCVPSFAPSRLCVRFDHDGTPQRREGANEDRQAGIRSSCPSCRRGEFQREIRRPAVSHFGFHVVSLLNARVSHFWTLAVPLEPLCKFGSAGQLVVRAANQDTPPDVKASCGPSSRPCKRSQQFPFSYRRHRTCTSYDPSLREGPGLQGADVWRLRNSSDCPALACSAAAQGTAPVIMQGRRELPGTAGGTEIPPGNASNSREEEFVGK